MSQLLSEREEVRRHMARRTAEAGRLERERDEAARAAAKAQVCLRVVGVGFGLWEGAATD
jgi:hypothetical protein